MGVAVPDLGVEAHVSAGLTTHGEEDLQLGDGRDVQGMLGDTDSEHSPAGEPGAPAGSESRKEGLGARGWYLGRWRLDVRAGDADIGDEGTGRRGFGARAFRETPDSGESGDCPPDSGIGCVGQIQICRFGGGATLM